MLHALRALKRHALISGFSFDAAFKTYLCAHLCSHANFYIKRSLCESSTSAGLVRLRRALESMAQRAWKKWPTAVTLTLVAELREIGPRVQWPQHPRSATPQRRPSGPGQLAKPRCSAPLTSGRSQPRQGNALLLKDGRTRRPRQWPPRTGPRPRAGPTSKPSEIGGWHGRGARDPKDLQ